LEIAEQDQGENLEVSLSRDLKYFDITMIGVGAMIGAGIFVLTGIAAGEAGPALVLAFLLNGIVTSFTAMSYAELGSAFPEAGGGYLWVKEAMGGAQGFLSGWMSWFAHAVAGSLYALAFGAFAVELWTNVAGLPAIESTVLGMPGHDFMRLLFMTAIAITFTYINFQGASETGLIGNVITMAKVIILLVFVIVGLGIMFGQPEWKEIYTVDFMPEGISGIVIAMGLTFIAFEGYEIIAQSGEEVINPKRNIPRAIFSSIAIVVTIYILVAFTAIGATKVPAEYGNIPVWQFLSIEKETAIVRSAEQILGPWGGLLILISALASTMSALNATTYSSARVSFAMGRANNLPKLFSTIHPVRHTPMWAVMFSGLLIIVMAWALPIEAVAAAADIMFLLLFVQVNIAVMVLRHKMPELDRGFTIPGFPVVPLIGIASQIALLIFLFQFNAGAFVTAIAWIVGGLLLYFTVFSQIEERETVGEILLEEVLVSTDYSVMVPIATHEQARILGKIGAIIAKDNGGEVFALHVARVPQQLTLSDGRYFLREGRPYLETVIEQARQLDVPVHTMIRLGRKVAESVRKTAIENASDLIVLGWPGYTNTTGRLFGSVIDSVIDDPPADIAIVRYRAYRPIHSILVPVSAGPNSRRAVKLAVSMARQAEDGPAKVHVVTVVPYGCPENICVRAQQAIDSSLNGSRAYEYLTTRLLEGHGVTETVLQESEAHDLVVMGTTEEPLFQNLLTGSIPARVAKQAKMTVIIVKRRSGLIRSMLRQTVVPPSTGMGASDKVLPEADILLADDGELTADAD
jgi:amino acid transporter/nucleotide-binding universal stress UspA family protein